jgi:hypothetical protein
LKKPNNGTLQPPTIAGTKMKTQTRKISWLLAGALIIGATPAMAQIAGSQHDLSSG